MENDTAINATLNATINGTAGNATTPVTTEGFLLAYSTLFIMAVVPIFVGSIQSVVANNTNKEKGEVETMSSKDAAMFPLYASMALFGIYLIFRIFSKEYINMLLTVYFLVLGVLALAHVTGPTFARLVPANFPNRRFNLRLIERIGGKRQEEEEEEEEENEDGEGGDESKGKDCQCLNVDFDLVDVANVACCSVIGAWYLVKKHWIANNMFGLAFSINAIELLHLNKIITGVILLGGLFIYDIFWVFGTDVMVTVAKSFEAPIKLVFPQDLIENGLAANKFAMLGLGDIVVPGIFVALLLRFDSSRLPGSRLYFYSGLLAYCGGLLATIVVMHAFKHAQPALLYLVPACLGTPVLLAAVRGELKSLFAYEDSEGVVKKLQ